MWNIKYNTAEEKQNQGHREQASGFKSQGFWEEGEGWVSRCKLLYRMYKQQGPTMQQRELYSISYDKHNESI